VGPCQAVNSARGWWCERKRGKARLFDPDRWGIPKAAVRGLGADLRRFLKHFRSDFKTRTRDTSACALRYWRGQLTMEDQRNFANIERRLEPGKDGQQLQQFMSDSPWSAAAVYERIQGDIKEDRRLQPGGMLIVDETADAKAGEGSAGAGRQYNGREGQVDICQVATCLSFVHPVEGVWTLVDDELFLPEHWFSAPYAELRQKLGVPPDRTFQTKPQLALAMIRRAVQRGLPFERVAADDLYGRNRAFRAGLGQLPYALQVPLDTRICLSPRAHRLFPVMDVALWHRTRWQHLEVGPVERGRLSAKFVGLRVWTPNQEGQLEELWLVIRRDADGRLTFTLLNDPADTDLDTLVRASCQRHLVERVIEDGKFELGWDDFCARKYLAWEHHVALTAAALWFIAGVKLNWKERYQRDPRLKKTFELEVLPALSTANVRDLLQATLPLPRLGVARARKLVAEHLVNRARSTKSRLKKQREDSS
jgi:SRSO17 transposase